MKDKESFLDREHTEILETLQAASFTEGSTKRIFSEMLSIFSYHLDREEETVMPLLHYLSDQFSCQICKLREFLVLTQHIIKFRIEFMDLESQ